MEFVFETVYDQQAVTAMARALRKTVRKKHSRRSHIVGWVLVVLALALSFATGENGFAVTGKTVFTWLVVLIMVVTLIWEDAINGYFARKRALPGTEHTSTTFDAEGYFSSNAAGDTRWNYENVLLVAEDANYFVFVLNVNHAQVYDKRRMTGGTAGDFRAFIEDVTEKTVEKI